jgi:drug/metabolite transporter (DMT)-like permease
LLANPASSLRQVAWQSWTLAIFTMLTLSVTAPIGKAIISLGIDPTILLALRLIISSLLLFGTIGLTAPAHLRIDRSGLSLCIGAGLAYGVAVLSFFWSLSRISASVASMLLALYPLVVLVLLALRGEKFTYFNSVRLALGLIGVYFLIGPGGQVDSLGIVLVLFACCAWAVYLVAMQWFLQGYDARTVSLYVIATMSVFTIVFGLVQGAAWHVPGWRGWLAVAVLSVVNGYLGQLALFAAIRGIGSGQMALLGPLETLLTVLWAFIFLHERLSLLQWLGGSLILFSMLLAVQRLRRVRLVVRH